MAVNNDTAHTGPLYGDGSNTSFPFDFIAASVDEVAVYVDGLQLASNAFSVALQDDGTGTVTTVAAPANGAEIYLASDPSFKETVQFERYGPYFPDQINPPLDRAAIRSVYLRGVAQRALLAPIGEAGISLPGAAARANKMLAFDSAGNVLPTTIPTLPVPNPAYAGLFLAYDANGNPTASSGTGTDAGLRTDLAAPNGALLVKASDGNTVQANLDHGGRVTVGTIQRTGQDKASDTISVKDFGAVGDGVTDDSAAIQAAIDTRLTIGGTVLFPKGKYFVGSQIVVDRNYTDGTVGAGNLTLSGYGATILSNGAFFPFKVTGGWTPFSVATVEGFVIDHQTETSPTGGVDLVGAVGAIVKDIVVIVNGGLPSGYAAVRLRNSDPTNEDTGSFWCIIDRISVRPLDGASGSCDYGVSVSGTANATTIRNCRLSGANTHIRVGPDGANVGGPNACLIESNHFEGPTTATAVELNSNNASYHVPGVRITGNRFESLDTLLKLTGTGANVQVATWLAGNYVASSVTTYIDDTLGVPVNTIDSAFIGNQLPEMTLWNNNGLRVRNQDGTKDALTVHSSSIGRGITLADYSGSPLASLVTRASNGSRLVGSGSGYVHGVYVTTSSTGKEVRQQVGAVTFAGETSKAVTFPYYQEEDSGYGVILMPRADPAGRYWFSSPTTTGFTINFSAAFTGVVLWELRR